MFKNKIETKTKESCLKEFEVLLEEITVLGISHEPYIYKKKVNKEEEVLAHGIEKNVDLNTLSKFEKAYYMTKQTVVSYYRQNPKDLVFTLVVFFLSILLLIVISKLNTVQNQIGTLGVELQRLALVRESLDMCMNKLVEAPFKSDV